MAEPLEGWREESGLRWRPCAPFGAEVDRDLSVPLSEIVAERLAELLRDHALIVAHGQALDRAEHNALLGAIGNVIAHREGDPGFIRSEARDATSTGELTFHSDAAYTATPFEALSLLAIDVVDGASSTRFVNVERGWEQLPAPLRAILEAHDADMLSAGLANLAVRVCEIREHINPGHRNRLPSVRTNPRIGRRYVAVSEMHAAALHGMDWEDSRETLRAVFEHLYAPDCVHEHVWRGGDLVIWDNIACQHARGSLVGAGRRVLQRVIVGPVSVPVRHGRAA
jgi:taurine dioxygenase